MAHRLIIMHSTERTAGENQPGSEKHRAALEAAANQLSMTSPRIFRTIKAQMIRKLQIPEEIRELSESQMFVLHALSRGKSLASELARLHNVTSPTMTRIVDGLVERGYVEREHAADDRRCIFLRLTEEGKDVGSYFEGAFRDAALQFLSPLTTEQLTDVMKAYRHLHSLLPDGGQEGDQELAGNNSVNASGREASQQAHGL